MSSRSIRASLLAGTALGIILVLAGAGTAVDRAVRSAMVDQFDQELERQAVFLSSTAELTEKGIELGYDELNLGDRHPQGSALYVRVLDPEGDPLFLSPGFPELPRAADFEFGDFQTRSESDASGRHLRVATLAFPLRVDVEADDLAEALQTGEAWEEFRSDGAFPVEDILKSAMEEELEELVVPEQFIPVLRLVVARDLAPLHEVMTRIRTALALVGVVSGALAILLIGVIVQRTLEPLRELASKISELDGSDLTGRLQLKSTPEEVKPVIRQLNHLLSELEAAFERERRFSADIAHELRTPLAGLRTTIEVELTKPRSTEEYETCLRDNLEIVLRLQDMVQTLLHLARLEGGHYYPATSDVDLSSLVRSCWESVAAHSSDRGLSVDFHLPDSVVTRTDPSLASAAISNLLENARVHADENGSVRILLESRETGAVLRVINSGSQVSQDDANELTDRFARHDSARSSSGSHYGLGLALVKQICESLNLTLSVQAERGGDFVVALSFPRSMQKDGSRT